MKRIFHLIAPAFLAAGLSSSVIAQCATSVNTGGGNCVPPDVPGMPGYNNNGTAPPPAPVWRTTWGAIVIDPTNGQAGTVSGRNSKADAISDATHDCQSRGAASCRLEFAYENQCAAVAWGTGGYGAAHGPNEDEAKGDALSYCSKSGTECKVVYSGCSLSKRVR